MIFTYEESVNKYGSKFLLKKAVEREEIFQLEKGVYSDKKYASEEEIIASKYPKAIFTLDSAFYHYNLTDVIPEKHYLATDRNASKIPDKRVVQIFEYSEILTLGLTTYLSNGVEINIYNKERLLVELLRHKTKLPFDYYKEVLLNYREIISELDIRTIQDYVYAVPKSSKIMETLHLEVL